jgi:hypothetical protein
MKERFKSQEKREADGHCWVQTVGMYRNLLPSGVSLRADSFWHHGRAMDFQL